MSALDPTRSRFRRVALAGAASLCALAPATAIADEPADPPTDGEQDESSGAPEPDTDTTTTTTTTTTSTPTTTAPTVTTTTTVPTAAPTTTAPATASTTTTTTTVAPTTTSTTVPPPVGLDVKILPERVQHVLATIRYMESRNQYHLPPNKGNASGAYQFIESTWAGHGGYQHAYLAPPHVQDERAAMDVQKFLDRFDGDVSMVPVMWYYPRAVREPALMDVVPKPQHGNILTIREYQTRWMAVFADLSGEDIPPVLTRDQFERRTGTPPVLPEVTDRRVVTDDDGGLDDDVALAAAELEARPSVALSYPVLGPSRLASLDCASDDSGDDPEPIEIRDGASTMIVTPARSATDAEAAGLCVDEAPGVVFGVKLQPVLAAADGVVTAVDDDRDGDRPISIVISSSDGISIEYRGFNDDNPGTDDGAAPAHLRLSPLARVGTVVRAGQVIGFMGDSDPLPPSIRAEVPTDASETLDPSVTAPHIRLTITDRDGRPIDAVGPLLDARARESCRVGIGGWSMPPVDGIVDEVTIETTDLHDDIDSDWVITSTGQVVATGWAAMINPVELCDWVPEDGFGPGANGSVDWLEHWLEPYELATEVWVDLALRDDEQTPDAFVLPG